ncbi:HNH endonuclease [Prevotella fusca]
MQKYNHLHTYQANRLFFYVFSGKIDNPKTKSNKTIKRGRDGQQKFREKLLEQYPYCPFTMVADDRLLIASHIKPWAAANEMERIDPYNGYMLTPTYDRLFDQGFITFTNDRRVRVSNFFSDRTCKQLGLENNKFIQMLPMDEKRIKYLEFHRQSVFKD